MSPAWYVLCCSCSCFFFLHARRIRKPIMTRPILQIFKYEAVTQKEARNTVKDTMALHDLMDATHTETSISFSAHMETFICLAQKIRAHLRTHTETATCVVICLLRQKKHHTLVQIFPAALKQRCARWKQLRPLLPLHFFSTAVLSSFSCLSISVCCYHFEQVNIA